MSGDFLPSKTFMNVEVVDSNVTNQDLAQADVPVVAQEDEILAEDASRESLSGDEKQRLAVTQGEGADLPQDGADSAYARTLAASASETSTGQTGTGVPSLLGDWMSQLRQDASTSSYAMVAALGHPANKADDITPAGAGADFMSFNMSLPTDTLFASQWHLLNTGSGLLDLNVTDVWDSSGANYTGAGVRVAVIDDAVQRGHHDLNGNIDVLSDWDFYDDDTDPTGVNGDNHGTAVAGIIASERDGTGTVGVAYDATLFGFRVQSSGTLPGLYDIFVGQITEAIDEASGQGTIVGAGEADVVNMSNGTQLTGNIMDLDVPTQSLMGTLETAIDNAASLGRGGLGTVIVKSAGNGRSDSDNDANLESWNANRHTISVAAVDQDGDVSSYSTHGSNLLVSGFGTPGEVVTTDRLGSAGYNTTAGSAGDYTTGFNGTSAAAPMVSGVVALMLEANSSLGWRDVQEILANSARHVGTAIGSGISGSESYAWFFNNSATWNGGGMHFSKDYGFGLVDAHAAVRLAETWGSNSQTSANETYAFQDLINGAETLDGIVHGGNTGGTVGTETYSWTEGTNVRIEMVTIDIAFETTYLGDFEFSLVSADGTTHQVIADFGGSTNWGDNDGFYDSNERWTYTTNAFWGEMSGGNWQLILTDDVSGDETVVTDADIRMYGSDNISLYDDRFILTNELSDYAGGAFGHSTTIAGGIGNDTLNAAAVTSSSSINLASGTATIDGVGLTLSSIENVFTGDGNDSLITGSSSVIANLGRGNDTATMGSGGGTVRTGAGSDTLVAGTGTEYLYGGDGNDYLVASTTGGSTRLYGEGGVDRFDFAAGVYDGSTTVYGGTGLDVIRLLAGGVFDFNGGGGSRLQVSSIEELEFRADKVADKTVILNAGEHDDSSEFSSTLLIDGNDSGVNAVDTIIFEMDGVTSFDASGWTFQDWVDTIDQIFFNGDNSSETITGTIMADVLDGAGGHDSLDGGGGNDTLIGRGGTDTLIGGLGTDMVDYSGNMGDGDINLLSGTATFGGTTDTLMTIENVTGGSGDDTITGDGLANNLDGGSGNDIFVNAGGSGKDTINGGLGNDVVTFTGGWGIDTLNGGAGVDTLDFSGISSGSGIIGISLDGGYSFNGGPADGTWSNFENVVGSVRTDNILGNAAANHLDGGAENDTIYGYNGDDTLIGGVGDDSLFGGNHDDTFIDNNGLGTDNDTFNGGSGVDTLIADTTWASGVMFDLASGETRFWAAVYDTLVSIENLQIGGAADAIGNGANNNILALNTGVALDNDFWGGFGHDTLNGASGNDHLYGEEGNDSLIGGGDDDTLVGGAGNDTALGGTGDDLINGGSGADVLNGSTGNDTLSYSGDTMGVEVRLWNNVASGGWATGDTISNFENLTLGLGDDFAQGTYGNNVLIGAAGNDTLVGLGGDDTVDGGGGDDMIFGDAGADSLIGNIGNDTINYSPDTVGVTVQLWNNFVDGGIATGDTMSGFENAIGGDGNDVLQGTLSDNALSGNAGNDTINGLGGNDTLEGDAGNDQILAGSGAEILDGGSGFDMLSYFSDSVGVDVSLLYNTALGGNAAGDTISNFSNVTGGSGDDTLQGSASANVLRGVNGDDTMNGLGGNDTLQGGYGDDYMLGGGGNDHLLGQVGADYINGGNGNDTITGGTAGDTFVFSGSFGIDTITDFGFADVARVLGTGAGFNSFGDYDVNSDGLINAADAALTVNVIAGAGGDLTLLFNGVGTQSVFFDNVGSLNSGDLLFV